MLDLATVSALINLFPTRMLYNIVRAGNRLGQAQDTTIINATIKNTLNYFFLFN